MPDSSKGAASSLALSVVVIVYNMRREAARTLHSLSARYQRGIREEDYEVLVVENGSTEPLDAASVSGYGPNFRYLPVSDPAPSPSGAVNFGIRHARGAGCAVMIDGARLASPGLLSAALAASRLHPRAVVATTNWHLGPAAQQVSLADGYTRLREDALLAAIGWPGEGSGSRLFEIAAPAASTREGIFRVPWESNFLCLPRDLLAGELGGCDERFDLPGGGLVNQDLFSRACALPETELVLLLGEATFHQLHGGISTNPDEATAAKLGAQFQRQYVQLRGQPFTKTKRIPRLYGHIPPALAPAAEWSARLSAGLDGAANDDLRTELVRAAAQQYAAERAEVQRWILLPETLPRGPAAAEEVTRLPVPGQQSRPVAGLPTLAKSWLTCLGRKRSRRKRTLLFNVNYRPMQGAHLKTWHYFQHARQSGNWEPRVYFEPETVWEQDNPWHAERAGALPEYTPEKADALFIDGPQTWRRLPAAWREHGPAPILATVQGFRHIDPGMPLRELLRNRAVRICVSEQVRAAIAASGRARGPLFVIPNAIDVPLSGPDAPKRTNGLFIAGMKNPELAREIAAELGARDGAVQLAAGRIGREEFLAGLRGASAALFLPAAREGFYLPALEAMALGTQVICPDVLGNRSFCLDGINCLRPEYTKEALLQAWQTLRAQSPGERQRMLQEARATAARHSLENERAAFLQVLECLPGLWQTALVSPAACD